MRSVSKNRKKRNREAKPVRDQFRLDHPECMVCRKPMTDIHEISQGPGRDASLDELCALLSVCRFDHDDLHANWSLVQQYTLKALRDPDNYDRVRLNELRGRAHDAISEREVWQEVPTVLRRIRFGVV